MRHHVFSDSDKYPVALLIKYSAFNPKELREAYLASLPHKDILAVSLAYDENGKASAGYCQEYLEKLLPELDSIGVQVLYVADANYFKVLTKSRKAEPHLGYCLDCRFPGYEHMKVILGVNHKSLMYNPNNESKMLLSLTALKEAMLGKTVAVGEDVLQNVRYPRTLPDIKQALRDLLDFPLLSVDIETFGLALKDAGLASIAFSWDKHSAVSFLVDYHPNDDFTAFAFRRENIGVRAALRSFFEKFAGRLVAHNCTFDFRVLVHELWMTNPMDTAGMLEGLFCLTRDFDDTKIISYLATNSTAGNELSLKDQAHEFAGNYAQEEIADVTRIPPAQLLKYNAIDTCATLYVLEKHWLTVEEEQLEIYQNLFKPSLITIAQMELCGMPLNMAQVQIVKAELEKLRDKALTTILALPEVKQVELHFREKKVDADNQKLKTKVRTLDEVQIEFNPNSNQQVAYLLYELLQCPVIDLTETGQPAVGADTLNKLHERFKDDPAIGSVTAALVEFAKADKVLSTFIPAFENAYPKNGWHYLHGNFNMGGAVSGRMSSNDPNLQNIPAGSTYGKLVKSCFAAPEGWLFCGADFNSLEDYISALTTRDPNKLKVYLEGYDGHSLRAYSYWPELFPDLEMAPESINSIKKTHDKIRSKSKGPTFALTYRGTYHTLMDLGFSEEEAKRIEANYHELYRVSDEWVESRLEEASRKGYAEVAFGLRVRCPLMARTFFNRARAPYQAKAESRTVGNAFGQSYGLLNNRAANAFMQKVWASQYRHDIRPVAMIHDAIYLMIRDDINVVDFVNRELITAMRWQELPELVHDKVKIGAELDLFWPDWAHPITLKNNDTQMDIVQKCRAAAEEIRNGKND